MSTHLDERIAQEQHVQLPRGHRLVAVRVVQPHPAGNLSRRAEIEVMRRGLHLGDRGCVSLCCCSGCALYGALRRASQEVGVVICG